MWNFPVGKKNVAYIETMKRVRCQIVRLHSFNTEYDTRLTLELWRTFIIILAL